MEIKQSGITPCVWQHIVTNSNWQTPNVKAMMCWTTCVTKTPGHAHRGWVWMTFVHVPHGTVDRNKSMALGLVCGRDLGEDKIHELHNSGLNACADRVSINDRRGPCRRNSHRWSGGRSRWSSWICQSPIELVEFADCGSAIWLTLLQPLKNAIFVNHAHYLLWWEHMCCAWANQIHLHVPQPNVQHNHSLGEFLQKQPTSREIMLWMTSLASRALQFSECSAFLDQRYPRWMTSRSYKSQHAMTCSS